MGVFLVSVLIFVVTLGASLLGLYAHNNLPPEQNSESAKSIVGQVSGLVSILLAIVLGTLIGTSFAFFGGQKTTLEALSAQILELDQALAQYGPETKPARDRLKEASQKAYDAFWGGGEPDPALLTVASPMAAFQATKAFLAGLTPTTEAQKQALASAGLVISGLTFGALCIAFAVFLMLELGMPYTGLFRVSPAALEQAIANLGR